MKLSSVSKILSGILVMVLIVQICSPVVYATEIQKKEAGKVITSFLPLEEDKESISIAVGAGEKEVEKALRFPESVMATVETMVYEEMNSEKENLVDVEDQNHAEEPDAAVIATDSNAAAPDNGVHSIVDISISVTWELEAGKLFSVEAPNTYIYTAKLAEEGYEMAEGVELPEISVDVVSIDPDETDLMEEFMRSQMLSMEGYEKVDLISEGYGATNHYKSTSSFGGSEFLPRALRDVDSEHYVSNTAEDIRSSIPYIHLSRGIQDLESMKAPITRIVYVAGHPKISVEGLKDQSLIENQYDDLLYNIAHVADDVEIIGFNRFSNDMPAQPVVIDAQVRAESLENGYVSVTLDTDIDMKNYNYIGLSWKYGAEAQEKVNELGQQKAGPVIAIDGISFYTKEQTLEFIGQEDALKVKDKPVQGDLWSAILNFDGSRLSASLNGQAVSGKFELNITDGTGNIVEKEIIPAAGRYTYKIIFTADGDENYKNMEVQSGTVEIAVNNTLPSYYCLRDEMILPTENQDGFNNCWAFTTLKCIQSAVQKQTGQFVDYSEAWLTLCQRKFKENNLTVQLGGQGDDMRNAVYQYIEQYGLVTERDFPFEELYHINNSNYKEYFEKYQALADKNTMKISATRVTDKDNIAKIKRIIKEKGAVNFNMSNGRFVQGETFFEDGTSLPSTFLMTGGSADHAVTAIGWDDKYQVKIGENQVYTGGAFIVQDSYGSEKRTDGIFYVPYKSMGSSLITSVYEMSVKLDPVEIVGSSGISNGKVRKYSWSDKFQAAEQTTEVKNIFERNEDIDITYTLDGTIHDVKVYEENIDVTDLFTTQIHENRVQIQSSGSEGNAAYGVEIQYTNSQGKKDSYTTEIFVWNYGALESVVSSIREGGRLRTNFSTFNDKDSKLLLYNKPNTQGNVELFFSAYHKIDNVEIAGNDALVIQNQGITDGRSAKLVLEPCQAGIYEFTIQLHTTEGTVVEYPVRYTVGESAVYASVLLGGDTDPVMLYNFQNDQDKLLLPKLKDQGGKQFAGWTISGTDTKVDDQGNSYLTKEDLRYVSGTNYYTYVGAGRAATSLKYYAKVEPKFVTDSIVPDLEAELNKVKEQAVKELDSYYNSIKGNYREPQQKEIEEIITRSKAAVQKATIKEEVVKVIAQARSEIEKIKTNAQLDKEEQEIMAQFAEAKKVLQDKIEEAKKAKTARISSDGTDIEPQFFWVTQAVNDNFAEAINQAENTLQACKTKKEAESGTAILIAAKQLYVQAMQQGKKIDVPAPGPDPNPNPDPVVPSIPDKPSKPSGGGSGSGGGSSSGGGGGGGGGLGAAKPAVQTPAEDLALPVFETITLPSETEGSSAVATVTDQAVSEAIQKAQKKNGIFLEVKVNTDSQNLNSVSVNFPKTVQEKLIKSAVKEMVIKSGMVEISMNAEAIRQMKDTANSDVNISVTKVEGDKLTAASKEVVGHRPIYDLKAIGTHGSVANFGKGRVSVSIPYALGEGENPANLIAYYIDSNGMAKEIPNSFYDKETKYFMFMTNHFSEFAVGYKSNAASVFADVLTHWAKDDIEFVAVRGLLGETGNGKFSPDSPLTIGMFVAALGRLTEVDRKDYANQNFAPEQSISREQMAVILANYANTMGFELPKVNKEINFTDNEKISAGAKTNVKEMQMAGIISGKSQNQFDPQGIATRAEASAALKRFVEVAINSKMAQGWKKNDSGQWIYYKNGKVLTGAQTINGQVYHFDSYGGLVKN